LVYVALSLVWNCQNRPEPIKQERLAKVEEGDRIIFERTE